MKPKSYYSTFDKYQWNTKVNTNFTCLGCMKLFNVIPSTIALEFKSNKGFVVCPVCALELFNEKHPDFDYSKIETCKVTGGKVMAAGTYEIMQIPNYDGDAQLFPAIWAKSKDVIAKYSGAAYWHCTCQICDEKSSKASEWCIYFFGAGVTEINNTAWAYLSGHVWTEECANAKGYFKEENGVAAKTLKTCLGCQNDICNVCGVCHTDTCDFVDHKVTTSQMRAKYSYLTAKTQKVRGYVTLAETSLRVPKPFQIITHEDDIEGAISTMKSNEKRFIRPCPMRPRHGFVDSRPIEITGMGSKNEISELLKKACAADEQGHAELLLVPFIKSDFNAIVTPSRVAIGPGHDGATGGHHSRSFPLAGVPFKEITEEILRKSKIGSNEDPYIEAVMDESRIVYFTQIRAGVKIPATVGADYVPFPVRVEEIIDASGDLLEWEAQTKKIKRGTVVCHLGGTLISHYGVHCMQNDIPVFTSRRPEIGEALDQVNRIKKPDPQAVIRGLGVGTLLPMDLNGKGLNAKDEIYIANALIAMMTILHNSAAFGGDDGFWIGVAVAIMYRAGMAASHGEARHKTPGLSGSRNRVYKLALSNFEEGRETLGNAQWKFTKYSWSSGYGGKAWAKCTQAILDMDIAARLLIQEPTESNVTALIGHLNNAVNQAHNGGWWLNKFITQDWFTKAAAQSLESLVIAGAVMYKIQEVTENKAEASKAIVDWWKDAPEIKVEDGNVQIEQFIKKQKEANKTAEGVPAQIPGWCVPYKSTGTPTTENYKGVFCEYCGKEFNLKTGQVGSDMTCGNITTATGSCLGLVGYFENGYFQYPESNSDTDAGGEIEEDNGEDTPDESDSPSPYASVSSSKHGSNINGSPIPDGSKIVKAQAQVGATGVNSIGVHLQYKMEHSGGYYSCDFAISGVDDPKSVVLNYYKKTGHPSYSGSGNNKYFLLDLIKENKAANSFKLANSSVKEFTFIVIPDLNNGTAIKFKEEDFNEPTEQTEQAGQASTETSQPESGV